MSESLFSNAGLLFFVAWSVIVGIIGVLAFGRDLRPLLSRIHTTSPMMTTEESARAMGSISR